MNPWLIFVIGTSCSGKSSFIKAINSNDYICLDDAKPLYKFFKADELLTSKSDTFHKFISQNKLENFYVGNKPHSIAVQSGGYRITNPAVWNYILQLTADEIVPGNKYIIEFSRGIDPVYIKAFNVKPCDIYKMSIESIITRIPSDFIERALIINIYANFDNRVQRNYQRRENGGHFVNENSMKTIYRSDIFSFDRLDTNRGYFDMDNIKIPVYSFENIESQSLIEAERKFVINYQKALEYYRRTQNDK